MPAWGIDYFQTSISFMLRIFEETVEAEIPPILDDLILRLHTGLSENMVPPNLVVCHHFKFRCKPGHDLGTDRRLTDAP